MLQYGYGQRLQEKPAPKEYSRDVVSVSGCTNPCTQSTAHLLVAMHDDFKQPTAKKTRLSKQSLSLTKSCTNKNHFGECVTSTVTKPLVPKNTQKNTGWALYNFCEWREKLFSAEKCRSDLLDSPPWDIAELTHWLCLYILETRRSDGKKYPVCSFI